MLSPSVFNLALYFMWLVWFRRNKIVHEKKNLPDIYWVKKCRDSAGFLVPNAGNGEGEVHGLQRTSTKGPKWSHPLIG